MKEIHVVAFVQSELFDVSFNADTYRVQNGYLTIYKYTSSDVTETASFAPNTWLYVYHKDDLVVKKPYEG